MQVSIHPQYLYNLRISFSHGDIDTLIQRLKIQDSSVQDGVDFNISQQELKYRYAIEEDVNDKLYLDERNLNQGNMSVCSQISEPMIDASFVADCNEIKSKLQDMYISITNVTNFQDALSIIDKERLIVTVDKLLELKGNVCTHAFHNGNLCGSSLHYEISGRGIVKVIQWSCDKNTLVNGVHLKSSLDDIKPQFIIMISSFQPAHCCQVTVGVKCLYFASF